MSDELRCLNCKTRYYSLDASELPHWWVCGKCAKTLNSAEIINLALDAEEDTA